jgi:hypothetical protein
MNEPEVLKRVGRYLDEKEFLFFVDSGYPDPVLEEMTTTLENCRINRTITIGRRVPDIIGFTNQREIFAVEVKGESAIRKGIGQAAHYRQGVHISYLAASDSSLVEFQETALSCGLGILSANDSGEITEETPVTNIGATDIDRTRRALAVKTSRFQSAQTSFPPSSRPEKALLPVITAMTRTNRNATLDDTQDKYSVDQDEFEDIIKSNDATFNQSRNATSISTTLQLINKVQGGPGGTLLEVTDIGMSSFYLLSGIVDSREESELYKFVSGLNRTKYLYKKSPELAGFLRDRYLAIPDVRLLVYVLASHEGSEAELSLMLAETAFASPDAFLNLFCGRGKEDEFRRLIEKSQPEPEDVEFRQNLLDLTSSNALYNFLYQIRCIGLLTEGTQPVHQDDKNPEVGDYHCEWDPKLIGEIGAESF